MAVNLPPLPELTPIRGVRAAAVEAGVRKPGRRDLVLFELAAGARASAVFTRNRFCAAPVHVAREHLAAHTPRYWLVNAGNANAGTGADGMEDARRCCRAVGAHAGVVPAAVVPFSTGVIGERLATDRIQAALPAAFGALARDGWAAAAEGIRTTDTGAKGVSTPVEGSDAYVTGIAKGAGMIRPDMATMLAFVATDASVDQDVLDAITRRAVAASFNRITIDGDTSTNDACALVATGAAGAPTIERIDSPQARALEASVTAACRSLAQAVVRDGEGATKFVTIEVVEGRDAHECLAVAYTIAHSPLVKTALFAGDPNWGRLLAAVGRAGVEGLAVERVGIWLDTVQVATAGGLAPGYREADGARVMAGDEPRIRVALGRGSAAETVWSTDLSYDYVRINAEYRS